MVEINFRIEGLADAQRILGAKASELNAVTRAATAAAVHYMEGQIKDQLRQTDHPRGTPTPSAPGEPPSLISGNLMRSVRVTSPTGIAGIYQASVGPTAIYSRIQELGGSAGRGAQLPARPYVRPAFEASRTKVLEIFATAWARVFRR